MQHSNLPSLRPRQKKKRMRLLGIPAGNFNKLYKKYQIDDYFEENQVDRRVALCYIKE